MLLVVLGASGGSVSTNLDPTSGGGTSFTKASSLSNAANTQAPMAAVYYKQAAGGETGTLTWNHNSVTDCMGMVAFSGVDFTNILDVSVITLDKTTGTNPNMTFTSPTVVTDGSAAIYVISGNGNTATATPASGFTEDFDNAASNRDWEVGHQTGLPPGTMGTINPTWSGNIARGVGILLVIRAAPTVGLPDLVMAR